MLHKELITIGKLKQAYSLTHSNSNELLETLLPDKVFPYALWELVYDRFWAEPIRVAMYCYNIEEPQFPTAATLSKEAYPTFLHTRAIDNFFADLLRTIESTDLENGFNYIMEATYGNEFPHKAEQDAFFSALRQDEWGQRNRTSGRLKIESIAASNYSFVSVSFIDTVTVDKKAAILWLHYVGCSLVKEVKGITKAIVDSIIASEIPTDPISSAHAPQPIVMSILNELHPAPVVVVSEVQPTSVFVTNEIHARPVEHPTAEVPVESAPANKLEVHENIDPNTVVIPRKLLSLARYTEEAIRDSLLRKHIPDYVIASVFSTELGFNEHGKKGKLGRLLTQTDADGIKDEKTYRNRIDKLLEKAKNYTIIIR